MSANFLLKYPAGFIPLKSSKRHQAELDGSTYFQNNLQLKSAVAFDEEQFQAYTLKPATTTKKSFSYHAIIGFCLVAFVHIGLMFLMMDFHQQPIVQKAVTPMTVSIIAPPSPEPVPEPEIVPIIKPVKIAKKVVVKPKEVVRKIVHIEKPDQPMIEATTEPVIEEQQTALEEAAPVAKPASAEALSLVEEVMEQPKFGVAYLNNPAPSYPKLSRRIGEQGRVLLKVLVSADGSANSVTIEKSSGSGRLDKSALEAVKQWRFIPARKGNQALSAYVLVPINFSLN